MRFVPGMAIFALVVGVLLGCRERPAPPAASGCVPSYRWVSQEPIRASLGVWSLGFRVALIGCKNELDTIRGADLQKLAKELRDPSEWSNLKLMSDSEKPEFRHKVTLGVNDHLGRQIVTDVIFSDVNLLDVN